MSSNPRDPFDYPGKPLPIDREELLRLIGENGGPARLDLSGRVFLADRFASDWHSGSPMDLTLEALRALAPSHSPWPAHIVGWLVSTGINLEGADLHGSWLPGTLMEGANLSGANLQGCFLFGTHLEGALLARADLRGATISGAILQDAQLPWAKLQGASLTDANLPKADLRWAELQRVNMYDVRSLDGAHWYGALLEHTHIKQESLGKAIGEELDADRDTTAEAYREAKEAYLLLKNNFNQIGRYEDASWAYVKEQQMEKMAHYYKWRAHGWKVWRGWRSLWRWFGNRAFEFLTGHGEEPLKAVRAGVFTVLGFAGGFCATRAVPNLWDALIYSLATFATFNLADTGPTGRGADVASSVEALLGIALLALVIFTLGNKMSRG